MEMFTSAFPRSLRAPAHTHTHARTRAHTRTHTHTHAHTHRRTRAHTHTCTHARMHARTHTCTHTHTHKQTRTHAHTHTRTHAHTHTHTAPLFLIGRHDRSLICPGWIITRHVARKQNSVLLIGLPQSHRHVECFHPEQSGKWDTAGHTLLSLLWLWWWLYPNSGCGSADGTAWVNGRNNLTRQFSIDFLIHKPTVTLLNIPE